MPAVPLIDVSRFFHGDAADRRATALAVDRACREIGFLVIAGHGFSPALRAELARAMTAFFTLPPEVKLRWAATPENVRGYRGPGTTALSYSLDAKTPPDLMERFTIGPVDVPDDEYHRSRKSTFFNDNRWPDAVPAIEPAAKAYFRAMEKLAGNLTRLFAAALGVAEDYFTPYIDRHISLLVTNYMPPQDRPPLPGQLRAGAHTDYGSLTILAPPDTADGLQVQSQTGKWEDVEIVPGAFVVNIGDLMAQWTNDRWVSTMHRVVNPAGDKASRSRMSLAFFHQPNDDAVISCIDTCADAEHPPRYAPITSGAHLAAKLNKVWITKERQALRPTA